MDVLEHFNIGKQFLIGCLILLLFGLIYLPLSYNNNKHIHDEFIESEFSGIIRKIEYTEKGIPIIYLDISSYELVFSYSDLRNYIQEGDSIVKRKGNGLLVIYRKVNDKYSVEYFNSW